MREPLAAAADEREPATMRAALRELERWRGRCAALYDAAPVGYVTLDGEGLIQAVNPLAARLLGVERAAALQRPLFDWVARDDRPKARRWLQRLRARGEARVELALAPAQAPVVPVSLAGRRVEGRRRGSFEILAAVESIAERRRAEEASRWFAQFPEENPNPVLRVAASGAELLYANARARALLPRLGATEDEPVPPALRALAAEALRGESVVEQEVADGDGRVYWFAAIRPRREAYVNLYALDITARARAEAALRASEERLRSQVEHMPIACILHDSEGRFTGWNPAAEQLFGYSASEALGKHPCDLIVPPQTRDHVRDVLRRVAAGEAEARNVNENVTKDGRTILCRWTNTPIRDAQGRVVGHLAMAEDVTERVRTRQALLQSQDDMDRAQAVAHTGSWRLDVQNNVLLWSEESWRIFGLPKGTPLTYETFLSTVHPDDRAYVDERWQAALRGEPYDLEHRIVVGSTVKWVREKAYLEFDPDGALRGGFGITQDITARKAMEEELRHARDQMELRVWQRTAELAETVRQLEAEKAATERAAARAEVTARLLRLFAEKTARRDYLEASVALLHDWSGCRCVGIRVLREDGGLPYEAQVGFSADFLRREMELNAANTACVCVRVATNAPEPQDEPALTPGGSFACADTPSFVAGLAPTDLPRYRGVCVRVGFRTLAVVPIRYRGRSLGAIHLADERPGMLSQEDIEFLESRALLIGEALHRFSLEEEVLAISEEERRRVGQELHDTLGQQLTGVAYLVDLLEDSLASRSLPEASDVLTVRKQLGESIARVRDLSHGLYPVRLVAGGLAAALAELAEGVRTRRGVACVLECDEGVAAADERAAIHLYRIAQEAVTNALKHAQAQRITLRLRQDAEGLCLEIADDGVGLPRDALSRKGLGLHIMQYRAENLGGRFEALAPPGGGTLIRCSAVGQPKARGEEMAP
ncbi:MAG TPA: PAS domain S-box protein [Planctomycetota bacterium]|nr:PAS domain S-box protein [Planctomycetota bacterium]